MPHASAFTDAKLDLRRFSVSAAASLPQQRPDVSDERQQAREDREASTPKQPPGLTMQVVHESMNGGADHEQRCQRSDKPAQ